MTGIWMVSMDEVRDVGVRCGVLPAGAAGSGMCLVCGMDRHRVMHRVEGRETLGKRSHYRIVWRVSCECDESLTQCQCAMAIGIVDRNRKVRVRPRPHTRETLTSSSHKR